jgi:hypothetical protein
MDYTRSTWGHNDSLTITTTMSYSPPTYTNKTTSRAALRDLVELERSNMLTPQGKCWLIQALDPFHDTDIPPTGFPDANIGGSIV